MKLTDTHRSDVFPIAMLNEKMKEKKMMDCIFLPSITLGLTVLDYSNK